MRDINEEKEICRFLEKKLVHFKQYLSVTEKMKHALETKEELNNLGNLISKRQSCANTIDRIDVSIKKIIKGGSGRLLSLSKKYKEIIDDYFSKIREIMTTVDFMNKEIMVMVKQEVESIKTEVLKTRNFRQAVTGYRASSRHTPRFLDTRR